VENEKSHTPTGESTAVIGEKGNTRLRFLLQELRSIAEEKQSQFILTAIDEETKKLASGCFYLAVLGQSKRGKSTFINALLGEEILPAGVIPVTGVATLVRYGTERLFRVVFEDTRCSVIERDSLGEYIAENLNPNNEKGVRYVEIFYPLDLLREGLVLIDTPGIGSVFLHNTETTQSFIPKVDAAIFVFSSDPIITQAECDFLNEVTKHVDRLFFVLNKIDLLHARDLQDVLSFSQRILAEKLPERTFTIHPVSSRNALIGKRSEDRALLRESNILEIEEIVRSFLAQHGEAVLMKRSQERARRLIAEMRYLFELEKKAIETPLLELQAKTKMFEEKAASLRKERGLSPYTLQGQIDSLRQWISQEMERFARATSQALKDRVHQSAETGNVRSYRDRVRLETGHLGEELVARIQQWRNQVEPEIVDRYQKIIDEYVNGVNAFIVSIHELSRELFDVPIGQFSFVEPLAWKRTFYYRVEDEPVFLELDWMSVASKVLPKAYLRRKMITGLLAFIDDKITRNCNNLKYEYSYSMEEHARTFQSELDRTMDAVVAKIQDVLRGTSRWKKEREADADQIRRTLCARLNRIHELEVSIPEKQ